MAWDKSSELTSGRDPVAQAGAELSSPKVAVRFFCSSTPLTHWLHIFQTSPDFILPYPTASVHSQIGSLSCYGKDPGMNLPGLDPQSSSNFILDLEMAPSFQPLGIEQPGFLIQFQTQTLLLRPRHLLQNQR